MDHFLPVKNMRKPPVLGCFQGVWKETSDMKFYSILAFFNVSFGIVKLLLKWNLNDFKFKCFYFKVEEIYQVV